MTEPERVLRPRTEREVEHKFRVHGLFQVPDLHAVTGVASVEDAGMVRLESTYFDTTDLRLAREGVTLRRRTGDDEGWQLKIPADPTIPGVRDEVRLPLVVSADSPPDELLRVVRVIVRGAPVRPVSTLRTDRSMRRVYGGAGAPIAELVDDTVRVVAPDGTVTARFRELELEERAGGPLVHSLVDALTTAGAVQGEFVAKVVRALGPAAAAEPEVPTLPAPDPDGPAGATAAAYAALHVRNLRRADIAFRSHPEATDEAVHRMRVCARRLRAALRTFRPLLDPDWTRHLRSELTWFARGLNDLREAEVLRARLRAHARRLTDPTLVEPVRAEITRELDTIAGQARADALDLLDSHRYLALHEELARTGSQPPLTARADTAGREVLPILVRRAWVRLSGAADALTPHSPDDEWHDVRLRAKRARYAAEAVAPALGAPAAEFAAQMERLTDLLGEHQDAVQAGKLVRRLADQCADSDVAAGLRTLAATEDGYTRAAREQFAQAWAVARRARWRRWFAS
ncbi:CYTH and CHAD domain-containing protein [Phytoactinopolyspora limicola]|uniref:CYTH and CHAD domain-containing protein n=1 Tax=Phytoactinopolyspora limicola TaxID=2715536 RepID=UPI00140BA8BD|nr:CYTH and CHAD domain-containing protein [Phytoactinopolyspora limicola]